MTLERSSEAWKPPLGLTRIQPHGYWSTGSGVKVAAVKRENEHWYRGYMVPSGAREVKEDGYWR